MHGFKKIYVQCIEISAIQGVSAHNRSVDHKVFLYNLYLKLPGDNYSLKLVLNKNI